MNKFTKIREDSQVTNYGHYIHLTITFILIFTYTYYIFPIIFRLYNYLFANLKDNNNLYWTNLMKMSREKWTSNSTHFPALILIRLTSGVFGLRRLIEKTLKWQITIMKYLFQNYIYINFYAHYYIFSIIFRLYNYLFTNLKDNLMKMSREKWTCLRI